MTDSLSTYDFWFYSRTGKKSISNVELRVLWLSPSGESLSETVYMKSVGIRGSRELYRSGMVPAECGEWQLSVRPVGVGPDFLGLGVIYRENHGAR